MSEPKSESNFHTLSKEEVLSQLKTSQDCGLSPREIPVLLKKYGYNELPPEEKESIWEKIKEQFDDPMVKILLVAAVISFLISTFSPDNEEDALPSWIEPLVIFIILIANGFVAIYQDFGAENSLEMLKKMEAIEVEVLRGSVWNVINARNLVPGDIIRLKTGCMVPADCRVIKLVTGDTKINQSFLTGESEGVSKFTEKIEKKDIDNLEKVNMMFSGSLLEIGTTICVVTGTGEQTELGKIRESLLKAQEDTKDDTTILREQLDDFGNKLTNCIAVICLVIWGVNFKKFLDPSHGGVIRGALYYFKTAVALGVAAIPEGLPAVITTCLALGTRRMIKKNALVRKLSKVETLGCTTVICTDKTGTLTKNEMFARKLHLVDSRGVLDSKEIDGNSYDSSTGGVLHFDRISPSQEVIQHLILNMLMNTQTRLICEEVTGVKDLNTGKNLQRVVCYGIPTEGALLCLGQKLNRQTDSHLSKEDWEMLWCYPFSSKRKCMSILVKQKCEEQRRLYVKGASEVILQKSNRYIDSCGKICNLTPEKREEFQDDILLSASEGYRMLGFAFKPNQDLGILKTFNGPEDVKSEALPFLRKKDSSEKIENDLVFQAAVAIRDPVKDECKDAIFKAKQAGINVIMITGDNTTTAVAIANQLDLFEESNVYKRSRTFANSSKSANVYTGNEWMSFPVDKRVHLLKTAMMEKKSMVFARTSPNNKRELVKMLKQCGEVVAMTGDGVNDAAALKQASIGIAMGVNGTDVAKEASDLVLLDDNFSTIVDAIEEGRSIYSNMKAFIRYMISSNIGEVLSIFFTSLMGIPEGLNSLQLLWVNLVTDGLPATALSFNKSDSEAMKKKPRRRGEPIMDNWVLIRYWIVGIYVGIATTGIFIYYYTSYNWSPDQQPLISLAQLIGWQDCPKFIANSEMSFNSGHENPCDYFTTGKKKASTLSLTVLVVIEMLNTLNALSENRSLFEVGIFSNLWLHAAIFTSIGIHCIMIYVPFMSNIFATVPLNFADWTLVLLFSMPVIFIEEILKFLSRRYNKRLQIIEHKQKLKID